jgi:hypothetical protein
MVGEDGPTNSGKFINWEVQETVLQEMKELSMSMSPATYEFLPSMENIFHPESLSLAHIH